MNSTANIPARAFAEDLTEFSKASVPEVAGIFCLATLIVSALCTLAHVAHLA